MGDSDDDFDRRRGRDKFMKERSEFQDRRRELNDGRSAASNRDYKSYRLRPEYSPNASRRRRRDWDETADSFSNNRADESSANDGHTLAPMMTFKQFLSSQDDMISDEEAIQKYQEYKTDYKKQLLHAFFMAHKDREWFRVKYHPEDRAKRFQEHRDAVMRRLEIFMELREKGWLDRLNLDQDNGENLLKFMDAVVIKLEGGTDEDIEQLEKDGEYAELSNDQAKSTTNKLEEEGQMEMDDLVDNAENSTMAEKENVSDKSSELKSDDGEISGHESEKGETGGELDLKSAKDEGVSSNVERNSGGGPLLLHKTSSIFLRNLAPTITKQELEALFKRYPGFLRVALAEPLPDRRFYRRGWVSFRRDVNVKEICWKITNIRLRDCDLGAIVNRDLSRRIRVTNGIAAHRAVAQSDLRLAATVVQMYDKRYNLWDDDKANENDGPSSNGRETMDSMMAECGSSKNPLLANISGVLIEEVSAEEEELLGIRMTEVDEDGEVKVTFERDEKLLKVLDTLLLYLRVVHSVDYYNHGEYPYEDEMPNRCGLIHVRGPMVTNGDEPCKVSLSFVNDTITSAVSKIQLLLSQKELLPDEEVVKLGKRDPEKEVEAFVSANCQELAKDKWLCPLSGKKFKGPEFVRKHIFYKHPEKVEEVRIEVEYFNNYLSDPKRPYSPDVRPQVSKYSPSDRLVAQERFQQHDYSRQNYYNRGGGNYRRDYYQRRDYGGSRTTHSGGGGGASGTGGGSRQYDGRRDPRVPIAYTDLDAPDEKSDMEFGLNLTIDITVHYSKLSNSDPCEEKVPESDSSVTTVLECANTSTATAANETTLRIVLTPPPRRHITWASGTVDNENLNRKKSKCCCIYSKPRKWEESSSESDNECEHCRGHVEKRSRPKSQDGSSKPESFDNNPPTSSY
ncbi:Serrate RNA effector molecule -like protein [Trichinella britovi]|uniref:Serrate RNA effector molecule homolog n=1 Tax=Trichinella britovi TaxID=45882 RepID=A0A0V1CJS2_TRIBR|nr:Serrate RNA effector molecule -like protein [Trichinella britovi]